MNVLDLSTKRVILKKASSTHGGEYQGPCPACGGTDRFHVWPEQNEGRGAYWCRGCEKGGDNIQFLRDFEGMTFQDACAYLNISIPERPSSRRPDQPAARPAFEPERRIPPADLWQEKAGKLITWGEENLAKNEEALNWLASRGISAESSRRYRLGWNPGENGRDLYRARKAWGLPEILRDDQRPKALCIPRGLVIPHIVDGVIYRIRIRRPKADRTQQWPTPYHVLPGSSMAVMVLSRERRAFVIIEAELDAIAVVESQRTAGAVALGSVSAKPDADAFPILSGALQILNALDYDAAGAKAMSWWADHFDRCDRWPVPQGKDPGDAFRMGTDLGRWIKAGLPPALTMDDWQKTNVPGGMTRGVSPIAKAAKTVPVIEESVLKGFPAAVVELYGLLRKNPGVKIMNGEHFTVLRDGKWQGGRISDLVFRVVESRDYLMNHPAEEIDAANLIIEGWKNEQG